jgi:Protein of unknown function (DUF2752)
MQLEPSPAGHGTHVQLGLPPCGFLALTGLPCPGCGLTTSFVHLLRGELSAAALANPLGIPLCLLTCLALPLSGWGVWSDACVTAVTRRLRLDACVGLLCAALFGAWFTRLLVTAFG